MLDSTAKLSDIITSLQNLEGINQKADLKSALVSKGISALDTDSMADLISKVNNNLYGSNIKSIQIIEGQMNAGLNTYTIPISPINPSNSIAIFDLSQVTQNVNELLAIEITNSTTITLSTSGTNLTSNNKFCIKVIEFNNVKSKQTGSVVPSANPTNVTISSVNPNKCLAVAYGTSTYSSTVLGSIYFYVLVSTATNLKFAFQSYGNFNNLKWQVIEFN